MLIFRDFSVYSYKRRKRNLDAYLIFTDSSIYSYKPRKRISKEDHAISSLAGTRSSCPPPFLLKQAPTQTEEEVACSACVS